MTNFIIPNEITVGYQKRTDTFTDKLGFITYKDDAGILRFVNAWEGWRDKTITPGVFENIPTEGFVLNKNSGKQWGNFERAEFVRIFDPRGHEFEISTDNLMQVILHNGISKGNGIEGKLVYGWDYGKRKVSLIPESCEDYKKHLTVLNEMNSGSIKKFAGKADIIDGTKYKFKNGKVLTYLGKFKTFSYQWKDTPEIKTGYIFKDDKEYYLQNNFNKVTHMLDKNDIFNEILLEFIDSEYIKGFPDGFKKYGAGKYNFKFKTI